MLDKNIILNIKKKILENIFLVLLCLNLVNWTIVVYIKINKQNTINKFNIETQNYFLLYKQYMSLETESAFLKNKNNPIDQALKLNLHPIEQRDIINE